MQGTWPVSNERVSVPYLGGCWTWLGLFALPVCPVTSWLSAFVYLALWQMRLELVCVSVSPATTRPSQLDPWPASSSVTSQTKDCRRHLNCFTSSVAASHAPAQMSMDLSGLDFSRDSPWKRISLARSSCNFQTPRRRGLTQ